MVSLIETTRGLHEVSGAVTGGREREVAAAFIRVRMLSITTRPLVRLSVLGEFAVSVASLNDRLAPDIACLGAGFAASIEPLDIGFAVSIEPLDIGLAVSVATLCGRPAVCLASLGGAFGVSRRSVFLDGGFGESSAAR